METRWIALLVSMLLLSAAARADDWPQWRFDAARTGASPAACPEKMSLLWSRELGPVKPAWPHEPRLFFDASYHPVVAGKTLFVGSSRNDLLRAIDTQTGEIRWTFRADGPIRLAPAVADGKVYVGSDDGRLYCLAAADGKLLWSFRGADSLGDRKLLGNGRLISSHPVRGGPVVADGKVYFTAGIWPWMGIFVHCLDAGTGKVLWTNDSAGSLWVNNACGHDEAQAFGGPSPQGHLAIAGDRLLVPCGRSLPACFDRRTGKLLWYRPQESKPWPGSHVSAGGKYVYCSGPSKASVLDLATGQSLGEIPRRPIPAHGLVLTWSDTFLADPQVLPSASTGPWDRAKADFQSVGKFSKGDLLLCAGGQIITSYKDDVRMYRLPATTQPTTALAREELVWQGKLSGTPVEAIAADGKLFLVTQEGGIWCFGAAEGPAKTHPLTAEDRTVPTDDWTALAKSAIAAADVKEGICLVVGIGSGRLAEELVRQSRYHVIAIDPDAGRVEALRNRTDAAGWYGQRLAALQGTLDTIDLPQYLAALVVSEDTAALGKPPAAATRLYTVLRPYGGLAVLPEGAPAIEGPGIGKVETKKVDGRALVRRTVGPDGSANWDHEYGDAAKTLCSKDNVRGPFGVLWFGGQIDEASLYIPAWRGGPGVQVVDGRLFVEGPTSLNCVDAYTGMMLWKFDFPAPPPAMYGQARDFGYYFAAAGDSVYAGYFDACYRLDIATGQVMQRFQLPHKEGATSPLWGYLCLSDDVLLAVSAVPIDFWAPGAPTDGAKLNLRELTRFIELYDALAEGKLVRTPLGETQQAALIEQGLKDLLAGGSGIAEKIKKEAAQKTIASIGMSTGQSVVAMDRRTGKVLWEHVSTYGLMNEAVAVGNGMAFAADALPPETVALAKKRGLLPQYEPKLLALDLKTGKEVWSSADQVEAGLRRLSYSPADDVLVVDCLRRQGRQGKSGDVLWRNVSCRQAAILRNGELLSMYAGAYDVKTGKRKTRRLPFNADEVLWEWTQTRGCCFAVASVNMILGRSSTAAYLDLLEDVGITNLGGFRTGCRNNVVAASGIVSIPRLTGCACGYPIQASVGLVHDEGVEAWSSWPTMSRTKPKSRITRLGVNLGAPGDRCSPEGTFWVEYPFRGGKTPEFEISAEPADVEWFCRHPSRVGGPLPWVAASGGKGLRSLKVTLAGGATDEVSYTLRLHFAECDGLPAGERVFSVSLQGQLAAKDLDIAKEAGGPNKALVKEFKGVKVKDALRMDLTPAEHSKLKAPLLCGVEIIAETEGRK